MLAEERQDVFGFGVASEHLLGEDQLAVEVDIEDAARPGNDLDDVEYPLPLLEDSRDQTGRVRQRASRNAVLDAEMMVPNHRSHRSLVGLNGRVLEAKLGCVSRPARPARSRCRVVSAEARLLPAGAR
jgi:hypothetical protein